MDTGITDQIERSQKSRWQHLYGSSELTNEIQSCKGSFMNCITESFEDSSQVEEWFDSLHLCRVDDRNHNIYPYHMETTIQLMHPTNNEEDEAQRIIDDLEHMIRDNDDDLMESILESERHKQELHQFRCEKKAQKCLHQWNLYTKNMNSRRDLIATAVEDRRFHHITLNIFQSWKTVCKDADDLVNNFKRIQRDKLLRYILRIWAEYFQYNKIIMEVR